MHIILVSDRMATAKTLTLTWRHLMLGSGLLVASVIALSTLFSYITVRHAAEMRLPFLQDLLRGLSAEETRKSSDYVRDNVGAMAVKLGQMQAQMMRLDSLGERLAEIAGIKPQEARMEPAARDGRGGPLVGASPLSADDLQQALDALTVKLEARADTLSLLESKLFEDRLNKARLPSTLPVDAAWNASAYGWRVDPITGDKALHEGVDFPAEVGTPIVAAAPGVVIAAERHPEYGLVIDIDHGGDLVTRYAHASRLLVQTGALVKRGQKIAEVGNTGRSTGPHLHFEVRINGASQNPNRFLQMANASGLANGRSAAAHRH